MSGSASRQRVVVVVVGNGNDPTLIYHCYYPKLPLLVRPFNTTRPPVHNNQYHPPPRSRECNSSPPTPAGPCKAKSSRLGFPPIHNPSSKGSAAGGLGYSSTNHDLFPSPSGGQGQGASHGSQGREEEREVGRDATPQVNARACREASCL